MNVEERAPVAGTPTPQESAPQSQTPAMYRLGIGYGRMIHRLRWVVAALWIVALAASLPFTAQIASVLTGGGYTLDSSESIHVAHIVQDKLHQPTAQVTVVFQSADTLVSDPAFQQEVQQFIADARGFSHVIGVVDGGAGLDHMTDVVNVNFDQPVETVEQRLGDFHTLLPTGENQPAKAYVTGDVAVYQQINQIASADTEKADGAALPIALVVLLVVFGTLVAALMPLLLALVAVPIGLAIVYFFALHNTTNTAVLSVASIVGLGLAIDYCLFLTRRFREELARGRSVPEAVGWTMATAGEAILFSGLTVLIGFCALLLLQIPIMTAVGVGGAAVVLCAVLAALTLLPALLSILGPRVNALRIPLIGKLTGDGVPRDDRVGGWHRLALAVMRRPVVVIVLVGAVLVAMGWPVFAMQIGAPDFHTLPTSSEARAGADILHAQYPATNSTPVYLIVQTPDGGDMLTADNLVKLDALTQWIGQQAHITGVSSLTAPPAVPGSPPLSLAQLTQLYASGAYQRNPALAQFVAGNTAGDTTLILAQSDTKLDSTAGVNLIKHLRDANARPSQGLSVLVGGVQAVTLDFNGNLYGNFPKAVLFILITTFVLLLIMFRSVLLPLKAVLMNVLSIGAAFGVLVWIFQWGNLQGPLAFTSEGFIETTVPILLFCILFGLSMDYEVFLLSRIREEWLRTRNNRYAVAQGLEKTGGTITSAALIFTIVTGAIATTQILATKETGLGMTVAVLVDATIIRSLLVPATMRLLGRWNWWLPGRPMPQEQPM
jgi:RND superfamily putative drug exporter